MKKHNRFTRLCILLLTVLMVSAICIVGFAAQSDPGQQSQDQVCYIHGDMNSDGQVDSDDAVYLLYNSLFGETNYPIANQTADFDGENGVTDRDAVFLLYCYLYEGNTTQPDYCDKLQGTVHSYGTPVWTWTEQEGQIAASLTLPCSCGESKVYSGADVTITPETKNPTCVDAGYKKYTAAIAGTEYTDTYTAEIIPATAEQHSWAAGCGTLDTESGKYYVACGTCGATKEVPGHQWQLDDNRTLAATCTAEGYQTYVCAADGCDAEKEEPIAKAAHTWQYLKDVAYVKDGVTVPCTYVKTYECAAEGCTETKTGTAETDIYTTHVYKAEVVKEANCTESGTMKYTCKNEGCTHSYEGTTNADGASHIWNEGPASNGIVTYNCKVSGCTATKTAVDATAGVQKDALNGAEELKLENDAALSMDTTLQDSLDAEKTIKITVEEVAKSDSRLDEGALEQVGNAKVYDFNMVYDNGDGTTTPVDFNGGKVTVTLPYTLQANEDIENIAVWYIADSGELTSIPATYSNGYVTFETTHFSYYTVTRLTAAERCGLYGHINTTTEKAATCTEAGHKTVLCQRCGEVDEENSKTYPATGHTLTEKTTEATCTTAGSVVKSCACSYKEEVALPLLGHKLPAEPTSTVDATCEAPGQKLYKCENEGCGHEYVELIKQLTHSYVDDANVAATCTTEGYRTMKCQNTGCTDVVTITTAVPLGHNYTVSQWNWDLDTDPFTASVELTCANAGCGSVSANAVVTMVEEKTTSCVGQGAVTYTAKATYNGKQYLEEQAVYTQGPGHKTGSDWGTTANLHYRICQVCEERVDPANHTWNSGAQTVAPTCVDAGVKQYRCTVCGYAREEAIPATGIHNYVDGVCTDCGHVENDCDHVAIYRTEVDVSGYTTCGNLEIWYMSCDCGQVKDMYWNIQNCEFGDEYTTETGTTADGNPIELHAQTCANCGLKVATSDYSVTDESCMTTWMGCGYIGKGSDVIAEGSWIGMTNPHTRNVYVETIDLTQKGLCGEVLIHETCACGEYHGYYTEWDEDTDTDISCNWQMAQSDMEGAEKNVCADCNAVKYVTMTYSADGCWHDNTETVAYYTADGTSVGTYTSNWTFEVHMNTTSEYEMLGVYCDDGIIVTDTCVDCDYTDVWYTENHIQWANSKEVDLSGTGICAGSTSVTTQNCPCPKSEQYYSGINCSFQWVSSKDSQGFMQCPSCGTVKESVTTPGSTKDANCYRDYLFTDIYKDASGNVIFTGYRTQTMTDHDMKYEYDMKGTSCEEGMTVIQTCQDCGYVHEYETIYHESTEILSYDLSQYGTCYTRVGVMSCPCEKEAWVNWYGSKQCNFQWVSWENDVTTWACTECGLTMKESTKALAQIDACHSKNLFTRALSKGGDDLLSFSYTTLMEQHDTIATLTLVDGATTCDGGYTAAWTCQNEGCDFQSESEGTLYGCSTYCVAREAISVGQLCSDLYKVTFSCACGAQSHTNIVWDGEPCDFNSGSYDETLKTHVWICGNCGNKQYSNYSETPIEGDPCHVKVTEVVTFLDPNGEELFSYTREGTGESHAWGYSFKMAGTTCADGYTVSGVCTRENCGATMEFPETYYSCEHHWETYRTVVFDGTGACGPVEYVENSCACGAQKNAWFDWNCNWRWIGDDEETGYITEKCVDCGLEVAIKESETPTTDPCVVNRTYDRIYTLNGETVGSLNRTVAVTQHEQVYSFNMNDPTTCEAGYTVAWECANCDVAGQYDEIRTGHERFNLERYDLSDYGVACGSEMGVVGCPCGQIKEFYYNDLCFWHWYGDENNTGWEKAVCTNADCGVTRYEKSDVTLDETTCTRTGERTYKFVDVSGTEKQISMDIVEEAHEYLLMGSDTTNCEEGYTATIQCMRCQTTSQSSGAGHEMYRKEVINLTNMGSTCGGTVYVVGCPCGQEQHVEWQNGCNSFNGDQERTGDEANGTSMETRTCVDCGLQIVEEESWAKVEGTCYANTTGTITITVGSNAETVNVAYRRDAHTWGEATYTLKTSGTTCEEGVQIERTCTVDGCGAQNNYEINHHETFEVAGSSVDLAQYGSECGAALALYSCACGRNQYYDFTEDSKCDFGRNELDDLTWLGHTDLLNDYTEQWTSEGNWHMEDSHAGIYGCAVTNSTCTVKLRMANYWRLNGCIATRYETWQVWDETTQAYVDIGTVATGEVRQHHTFDVADGAGNYDQTNSDGARVQGTVQTCTVAGCGSYVSKLTTFQTVTGSNGNTFTIPGQYEEITVNTTGNGDPTSRKFVDTFGYIWENADGEVLHFSTKSTLEVNHADGTVFTEESTYTHDFDNQPCWHTWTYQNSEGGSHTREEECHFLAGSEDDVESTCTQFGEDAWKLECCACGNIERTVNSEWNPMDHDWILNSATSMYECSRCGLESEKGYSGSIVMEDLTDEYGNGTDYVVGYWKQSEDEFVENVTVILEGAAEGEDEVLLSGITFTYLTEENDGITAVSFNQADALSAAAAAVTEAGHTGNYAIRLSFVPVGATSDLDYAITFDTITQTTAA